MRAYGKDHEAHSSDEDDRSNQDDVSAPSSREVPVAPSSGSALATVSNVPPRESKERISFALRSFLASKAKNEGQAFIRGVIIRKLYGRKPETIEPELVAEIVQTAQLEALELRWPPWTLGGIPGWCKRLAERNVAAYFDEQKNDKKYLQHGVAMADIKGDRHGPETDYGAREHLIVKYLEPLIGDDPYDQKTFRLMWDKEIVGFSLGELAALHGTTPPALSMRFHKLRKRLAPRITIMDREKPRRAILLLLIFGGFVAAVLALWFLFQPGPSPEVKPRPTPSATSGPTPLPIFNQAVPKPPSPAPPETPAAPAQPQAPAPPAGNVGPNDKVPGR